MSDEQLALPRPLKAGFPLALSLLCFSDVSHQQEEAGLAFVSKAFVFGAAAAVVSLLLNYALRAALK